MNMSNTSTCIVLCMAMISVAGCTGPSTTGGPGGSAQTPAPEVESPVQVNPDLVPVRRVFDGEEVQGREGLCRLSDDATALQVSVRNAGNGSAPASTTMVTFRVGDDLIEATRPTPSLSGGQTSSSINFPIPTGCFSSDCRFTIELDSENAVLEGSIPGGEANNVEEGICIG